MGHSSFQDRFDVVWCMKLVRCHRSGVPSRTSTQLQRVTCDTSVTHRGSESSESESGSEAQGDGCKEVQPHPVLHKKAGACKASRGQPERSQHVIPDARSSRTCAVHPFFTVECAAIAPAVCGCSIFTPCEALKTSQQAVGIWVVSVKLQTCKGARPAH